MQANMPKRFRPHPLLWPLGLCLEAPWVPSAPVREAKGRLQCAQVHILIGQSVALSQGLPAPGRTEGPCGWQGLRSTLVSLTHLQGLLGMFGLHSACYLDVLFSILRNLGSQELVGSRGPPSA